MINAAKKAKKILQIGYSGYFEGLSKALDQKKNNVNITNVVTADQAGKFPDDNIGDALKRISGISVQNDQGEARNIVASNFIFPNRID